MNIFEEWDTWDYDCQCGDKWCWQCYFDDIPHAWDYDCQCGNQLCMQCTINGWLDSFFEKHDKRKFPHKLYTNTKRWDGETGVMLLDSERDHKWLVLGMDDKKGVLLCTFDKAADGWHNCEICRSSGDEHKYRMRWENYDVVRRWLTPKYVKFLDRRVGHQLVFNGGVHNSDFKRLEER